MPQRSNNSSWTRRRRGSGEQMIALRALAGAFVARDWTIQRSYRLPFLMETFSLLFSVVLFFYISKLIGAAAASEQVSLPADYFSYVVVGMVVYQLADLCLDAFSSRLRAEQVAGTLEALLVLPVSPTMLVIGSGLYECLRAIFRSVLLVAAAMALGARFDLSGFSVLVAVAVCVSMIAMFSAVGVVVAAFTMVFKQGGTVTSLISAAVALLGGVYFPISLLPTPLRLVASAWPVTWGIEALRAAVLAETVEVWQTVGVMIAAAGSCVAAHLVYTRAVDKARTVGSLSQY